MRPVYAFFGFNTNLNTKTYNVFGKSEVGSFTFAKIYLYDMFTTGGKLSMLKST